MGLHAECGRRIGLIHMVYEVNKHKQGDRISTS